MGARKSFARRATPPIAIHYGSDVIRMMQIKWEREPTLHCAVEVTSNSGISAAMDNFIGCQCVLGLPTSDFLVQHIRVAVDSSEQSILEHLLTHDTKWGNMEIRNLCVATTGSTAPSSARQEILCLGVDRNIMMGYIDRLEISNIETIAVTIPIYASVRAFDNLHRRKGDEKMTSMLIDIDDHESMLMIAHGSSCVFAKQFFTKKITEPKQWEPSPSMISVPMSTKGGKEQRGTQKPRGLHEVEESDVDVEQQLIHDLEGCLRHHNALFPDRAVDRIIFSGHGANNTDHCASIAAAIGIAGYIADPSAWIAGAEEVASGPAWTTVAGMCLRYTRKAA